MNNIVDIELIEFFSVGDKVSLDGLFGLVVQTYDLDGFVITGGNLVVMWDTSVDCDYQVCNDIERHLKRVSACHTFKFISDGNS